MKAFVPRVEYLIELSRASLFSTSATWPAKKPARTRARIKEERWRRCATFRTRGVQGNVDAKTLQSPKFLDMSAEEEQPSRVAIGISFGNSYSSIASTVGGGDPKVIANEEGDRQIPSILAYVDGEEFHGTQAKSQLVRNSKNTVAGFRDFLGKDFKSIDPTTARGAAQPQEHESTVAFSIRDSESESPSTVTVSEIATRHLRRLAASASDYLGKKVTAAVITVPTDFTQAQKAALVKAAKDADIEVLQLITEPIAALLAHDRREDHRPADKTVVVADLGANRSDVAVVSVRGGMYSILATTHDYAVGGLKLDETIQEYVAKEFVKKHKVDPRETDRGLAKMRLESEACKKALSLGSSASFAVESLANGIDFTLNLNRTRYDMLAGKVYGRFVQLIQDAIVKAELDVLDIDEVLVSGGTAHTPRIASNLGSIFPESTQIVAPASDAAAINPSELTARGAALQAYMIESYDTEDIDQSTHAAVTVTPHLAKSIGLVLTGDEFKPIIPAETPLPVRRTVNFTATSDSEAALIRVAEGIRDIKITQPEPKAKQNGKATDNDEDDDEDEDSEEEDEEKRETMWKVGNVVGELALKDVKKGSKVTVQVQVGADLEITMSAMVAGKSGVKGSVPGSAANGAAH
ncbi:hypothetical protein FH972_024166 [Carpinus fangiana]|uniref:Uncharacterized protein n=1 Tax=Carpinus fangiana TaxID=176857 RepID=A0A5N6KX87_9ROSI|nr:hypothetical protein FH972_024166 [Carpinus fangiana]